jgi:hypothetical protein
MRTITGKLPPELNDFVGDKPVARADAYVVQNYHELMQMVAYLSFLNKDYLLFYRGQGRDFTNKGSASTFYPNIYRGEQISKKELELRFTILNRDSDQLCSLLHSNGIQGCEEVEKYKYVQWSILQHYEVCSTPLLDITQSLRVACTFAFRDSQTADPFIFVFGLPYLTNRISSNTEQDMVIVRLLSICPPDALRPYFQEGYLVGTEETTTNFTSKEELDLNNRLLAKFQLKRDHFWEDGFIPIPENDLFPNEKDDFLKICGQISYSSNKTGKFLKESHDLESIVATEARRLQSKAFKDTSPLLQKHGSNTLVQFDKIRQFRNRLVSQPADIDNDELKNELENVRSIKLQMR